jgi:hypothetical protein
MEGRGPVVLLLDNFAGHNTVDFMPLKNLVPIFLPPKTKSVSQPLDAEIISSFKLKYRARLMTYVCQRVREGGFRINEISLSRVAPWISESFHKIKATSIHK